MAWITVVPGTVLPPELSQALRVFDGNHVFSVGIQRFLFGVRDGSCTIHTQDRQKFEFPPKTVINVGPRDNELNPLWCRACKSWSGEWLGSYPRDRYRCTQCGHAYKYL